MGFPTKKDYVKNSMIVAHKIMDIVIDGAENTPKDENAAIKMLLYGQAGLAAAARINIQRLTEVGLIPQDLGEDLEKRQQDLSVDLHKALAAASILAEFGKDDEDTKEAGKTGLRIPASKAIH